MTSVAKPFPTRLSGMGLLALWCIVIPYGWMPWVFFEITLESRGIDLSRTWGGLTVCMVVSYYCWFVYHLITRRCGGLSILLVGYFPLIMGFKSPNLGHSWREIVWQCAWPNAIMIVFWPLMALVLREIFRSLAAKKIVTASPMWDADADRPLLSKEQL